VPEFVAASVVGFAWGMPSVRGFLPVEDGGRGEATDCGPYTPVQATAGHHATMTQCPLARTGLTQNVM